jgi:hypothetical protein
MRTWCGQTGNVLVRRQESCVDVAAGFQFACLTAGTRSTMVAALPASHPFDAVTGPFYDTPGLVSGWGSPG